MKNKYNVLQILAKVYRHTLKAVPFSGILGIINYLVQGMFPAVTSLISARLFDTAYLLTQGEDTLDTVILCGSLFVSAYAVAFIFQFISSITINAGIYERCTSYYNMKISEKAAGLPLLSFENANILNLQKRAQDCTSREVLSQIYMSSTVSITNGISVIFTLSVLASYNIWFIPISVISVVPYFVARIIRGKEFYLLKRTQAKHARRLDYLWKLFYSKQAVKEMRVMGFGEYLVQKWTETRDDVNEELWEQNIKDSKSMLFCDALKIVGYGLSILLALFLVIKGYISIGMFGACIAAFKAMQEATKTFLIDLGNLPEKVAFANDFFEFLDLPEEKNGNIKIDGIKKGVFLSNVSFTYPNSKKHALKDISLSIHKGEKIVVLGVNGSGKTTLSKILLNAYPPSLGEVRYDQVLSSDIDKSSLYTYLSVIPQNFVPYYLTLRENIAISDLEHLNDDLLIEHSLKSFGLPTLLTEVGSLDQQLGREFGGKELSGGQWQKLAIARGLFKSSDFIILDEPTSALDPLLETEILQQFIEISRSKTAVIISHRVGLCKIADRIIVMKDGKICEMGTHDDLIERDGEYRRLYTAQEQWYR